MRLRLKTSGKPLVPVLAFVLALLMWGYYAHTRQLIEQRLAANGFPERNFSDLFPRWLATRELLLNGCDPYSAEVTRDIQRGYYGRPLDRSRATDPIDEQRFAYPLFVVFLLAPTIGLPFTVVKSIFTLILSASAVWTVLLWIQVMGLKAGRDKIVACILLALATIPYAQGIQLQQLSVLVAFLLAASVYALAKEKFIVAGSLLALATIKPQLSIWFIGFVLLWSVSRWRSRKWVAISFFTVLIVFMLASEVLLPGWSFQFLAGIPPYLRYTQATTSVHQLFGRIGETIVLLLLAAMVALAAWRAKFEVVDSGRFRLAVSLVLVFTCVFIPSLAPHNQVLLVPAYLLLVKERKCIWAGGRIARSLWSAAWLTIVWPWVAGALLATTLVFDRANSRLWDLPLATNPLIPIAAFTALVPLLVRQADRPTSFC
ncbi:MAG TPA: glycosyltransferase family 87 protein [Terriglobales bacterium]|nr:glycosyltransferase family 87 protein [Terriglobales bacterium]